MIIVYNDPEYGVRLKSVSLLMTNVFFRDQSQNRIDENEHTLK